MILSLMRFAGFTWEHNPLEINISQENKSNTINLGPFGERKLEGSRKCTVIKGKGELIGENCVEVYEALSALFKEKKSGILTIPGLPPIRAQFSEFNAQASTLPDVITYSFTFTECESSESYIVKKGKYLAKEGENLFDISDSEGVPLDTLVKLNPHIRYIDDLREGEEVLLC